MRLDLSSLDVQSFAIDFAGPETDTIVEGPIAEPVVTQPVPIDPETRFHPCTYNLTCKTCV